MFLIRDWYHQKQYAHGFGGGEEYLRVMLQVRAHGISFGSFMRKAASSYIAIIRGVMFV